MINYARGTRKTVLLVHLSAHPDGLNSQLVGTERTDFYRRDSRLRRDAAGTGVGSVEGVDEDASGHCGDRLGSTVPDFAVLSYSPPVTATPGAGQGGALGQTRSEARQSALLQRLKPVGRRDTLSRFKSQRLRQFVFVDNTWHLRYPMQDVEE